MLWPMLSSNSSDKSNFLFGLFWKVGLVLATMAVGTAFIFWVVLLDRNRMRQVFGPERGLRLHVNALTFVANLPAPDSDRDGVPDWARYNPHLARDLWLSIGSKFDDKVLVYQGERTKVRVWNRSFGVNGSWAPGFRALVCANRPILFPPGSAGPATEGPIELITSPSGTLDFEVLAPEDDLRTTVELINSANGELIGGEQDPVSIPFERFATGFVTFVGKRFPPIECRMTHDIRKESRGSIIPDQVALVDFDLVPGATGYVLEMATPNRPDEWHPIKWFEKPDNSALAQLYAKIYRASFRIVPTR